MGKIIAAYGGGFKPPTAGHFEIVDTALEKYPEIDEFIVYVGSKVRDGIDQTEAILVWDIYQNYLANKVKIEPVKSPIGEILRLAKNNPQDTIYFVIGYRDGRQDDLDDVEARTGNLSEKYPNIEVKVIPTYNPNMSGTNARKALNQSEEEFIKFLPSKVKEKSEIFQILRPPTNEIIKEEITKSQLNTIETYADKLFAKLGIDIEFTKHFLDRVNDKRNNKPISVAELMGMFKRLHKKHGKPLSKVDNDFDAVVKDFNNNINIPFAINVTPNDIDLVAKTVMRKKDFKTSTPVIALEENATYSKSIDIQEKIIELTNHMLDKGMNIEPLPTIEFVDGDSENASDFFGRTAYYDPDKSHIVLYTEGRHPKDIVRSYAHEMIHHIQNLENRLGNITTTDTTEDSELDQIEREAYLNGNMTFRNWTDSIDGDISTSLTEGKYDSLVTKLSGFTLNSWKGDFEDGQNQGYFELEIGPGREFDYPHLNFNYKAKASFVDFYRTGGLARPRKKMPEVIIEYWLDTDELPRMWSQIAMSLRNTIRHEIEHLMQSGINTKQGKEMGDDSREREELRTGKKPWWKIWRKTLGTPEYYKLEKEVDANLQGLYLKAKKIRQPLEQVIDNYVKYELNLPIEDQEEIKRIWSERAPELNIPLEENKDYFGLNQFIKEVAEEILISEEEVVSSPSMKYKIYSDMDGVLTDFDKSFEKYSKGIPPREYEKKYGKDKFWELIDGEGKVGFWVGMPWMEDGKQYWDYIKDYNTELLSSPSRSSTSRLGKRLWVKNNMPGVKLTLAQAAAKQNYAAPNHILIDDRKSNIDQWRSQGGIGILHTSAADTIQQLKKLGL